MGMNVDTANEADVISRAIEILKVMYPGNSRVTSALSFRHVEKSNWLYDIYDYFEDVDVTDKIYLDPRYTSKYVWENCLDGLARTCFVIPYKYFSMSDDEIVNDYKERKETARKERERKNFRGYIWRCKTGKAIPIDYMKSWGSENKCDEVIDKLIDSWSNFSSEDSCDEVVDELIDSWPNFK